MPAVNEKQRKLFAIAEHAPNKLHAKNKHLAKLPHQTLHDFASKVVSKFSKRRNAG
jgi:hypothetical protein